VTIQWEVPVTPAAPQTPHCVCCANAECVITTSGGSVKKCAVKECTVCRSDVRCRERGKGIGKQIEDSDVSVGRGAVLLRRRGMARCV
jgi:hypothetical protein